MARTLLGGGAPSARVLRRALAALMMLGSVAIADTAFAAPLSKKVAVIMFKPQNYGSEWVSAATVRSVVWTGESSVNEYYKEVSYGKVQITGKVRTDGDIYGWYTIPYSNTGTCPMNTWTAAARTMAAKNGFDPLGYNSIIYVTAATGCPGRAWASGSSVVVLNGFGVGTVAHELGHTFGLDHASAWKCKDSTGAIVTLSSTCNANEYGDFATMGQTGTKHFNAYHKGQLGFLAASNTLDVTTTGIYSVFALETATTNVQVLRIPRSYYAFGGGVKDYYYVEFRQPYGFDKFADGSNLVNGVILHVAPPYTVRAHSFMLDTTPTATGLADPALAVGQTFTDSVRKVSLTTVSVSPTVAYVKVTFTN